MTAAAHRSTRLATAALLVSVALGGMSGAQAATAMGPAAPTLAVPTAVPADPGQDTFEAEVLRLTNEARAKARKCGGKKFRKAKPLRWSDQLAATAAEHSADMANRDYFSHYAPGGVSPFQRMRQAGYDYRAAGENIAAGRSLADPGSVVQAWLHSPGHCRVIMNSKYHELGVGRVEGAGKWGVYWTQNFGTRKG